MRALVTGAAGFIGSSLVDRLLADGHDVRGIDCFTPYYDRATKERNMAHAHLNSRFEFVQADLRVSDPGAFVDGIDVVFHQAAQPGVRLSWSNEFVQYQDQNILVTQRLLQAACEAAVGRFVFASSSSVYGNAPSYPTLESQLPQPHSPYGVTKLAAEHLCRLYADNFGLSTIALRYFTVYGPRQRPDMATHRLVECALRGREFQLYGTGEQIRDFTFVEDVVRANIAAAAADVRPGTVCNIAGGGSTTMNRLVALVEEIVGSGVRRVRVPGQAGDVYQTGGATDVAAAALGWKSEVDLRSGLIAQVRWHRSLEPVPLSTEH